MAGSTLTARPAGEACQAEGVLEQVYGSEVSTAVPQEDARTLFDAHYDFVWRSLRGLGVRPGSIDDGAQQVFLLAFRKLSAIAPGSERAFLFRLASGVASNLRRTVRRRGEVDGDAVLDAHADAGPAPEDLVFRGEARELLDAVLAWLPGDLRTVFVLFELEEMEIPDIAALLEIPVGTVGSRLRRAREKFEVALKRVRKAGLPGRTS